MDQKQITNHKMEDKKIKNVKEQNEIKTNSVSPKSNNKETEVKRNEKIEKKESEKIIDSNYKKTTPKKIEAVVNGRDLRISTKHAVAVCNYIKNKDVDIAIRDLEEVGKMRKPIPMRGEIPHKKGMMSGRYPINAVYDIIRLLKSVKSNALSHEIELEKVKIACMANVASRPAKRFGQGRHKRSHVQIKLIPRSK